MIRIVLDKLLDLGLSPSGHPVLWSDILTLNLLVGNLSHVGS